MVMEVARAGGVARCVGEGAKDDVRARGRCLLLFRYRREPGPPTLNYTRPGHAEVRSGFDR